MSTPQYPHQKLMQDQGIDLKSEVLSPSTRRAIEKFDGAFADLPKFTDETRKNIALTKLTDSSAKIVEQLEADIKENAEKAADALAKKKAKEDEDKKAADEKKKKEEDEKNKKPGAGSKTDNPYDLSDSKLAAYKVIDKLFAEKAKNGEMIISEKDMSAAGFNPWVHLGMQTGKLGNYNFKASLMSDDWTVTKDKKDPAPKA